MALLVMFTMGLAIWHFCILFPDRYFGGVVGALGGAIVGSYVFGLIFQIAAGRGVESADLATALVAVPGAVAGMMVIYLLGSRRET